MTEVPLTRGYVTVVDDVDNDFVLGIKWHAVVGRHTKYAARRGPVPERKDIKLHRLIATRMFGVIDGFEIDHRDCDGLNNTRANIRLATHSENMRNRRCHKKTSSQFRGVSWNKALKKWEVRIQVDNSSFFLGRYLSEKEAAEIYDVAAIKHHGDFARLNFRKLHQSRRRK